MIAHLRGREKALHEHFEGQRAEWVALVCLHSGAFTRRQFIDYCGGGKSSASRFVDSLKKRGMARETTLAELGQTRIVRIVRKDLYRLLGIPNVRHRRPAKAALMVSRLLALDFILDHPRAGWKPTEGEKVQAFTALGISRGLLPSRVYGARSAAGNGGRAGKTRRYFPHKLPVAVAGDRIDFVYTDPGHVTTAAIRTWGTAHAPLWADLRQRGAQVVVTAVCRDDGQADRAERVLTRWRRAADQRGGGAAQLTATEARDLAGIRKAIRAGQADELARWGGVQKATAYAGQLARREAAAADAGVIIHAGAPWVSSRLPPCDPRRFVL